MRNDNILIIDGELHLNDGRFIGKASKKANGNILSRLKEYANKTKQNYKQMLQNKGMSPEHIGKCPIGAITSLFPEIDPQWLLFGLRPPSIQENLIPPPKTKERIKQDSNRAIETITVYAKENGLSLYAIANESGVSQPGLYNASAGRTTLSEASLKKILTRYPEIERRLQETDTEKDNNEKTPSHDT